MTATMLDIVLALILVAYAVTGYGRGLIATATSAIGFISGGLIALWLLPGLIARILPVQTAVWRPVVLVVLVLVAASIGQGISGRLGAPAAMSVRRSAFRPLDSALGAVLTASVTALAVWVVTGVLALAPVPALRESLASSRVLSVIDDAIPVRRSEAIERLLVAMSDQRLPDVFASGIAPDLNSVGVPGPELAASSSIETAARSVYRIDAIAPRCGRTQEGSGWAVGPESVVTNAHVVAGADTITIRVGGVDRSARVVVFDPDRDLALLHVSGLNARPLQLGSGLSIGSPVVLAGYPLGGPYSAESGRVGLRLSARGTDIYGKDKVVRDIYAVRASVQPGNSGGPALAPDGTVAGVVFARSLDDSDTAYVLTLDELRAMLKERRVSASVGATACAA